MSSMFHIEGNLVDLSTHLSPLAISIATCQDLWVDYMFYIMWLFLTMRIRA